MGIPGFLEACEEVQKLWNLKAYAAENNYQPNEMMRVGVDAKVVIKGCSTTSAAKDSFIATLESFVRVLGLYSTVPMAFVFVFDGPDRPSVKSNIQVESIDPLLYSKARQLLDVFCYPSITAPGDAHSFFAALANTGVIDAVISDDADLLLLGVPLLFRKAPRSDAYDLSLTYNIYSSENIQQKLKLTRGGMILAALLMGSDYDTRGVTGCGLKTAMEIASQTTLRDQLLNNYRTFASATEYLTESLDIWRDQIRLEVAHNPTGNLSRRRRCVAAAITDNFPNLRILEFYSGRLAPKVHQNEMALLQPRMPDLLKLVAICREVFAWTDKTLYDRFKEYRIWGGIVTRMLASPSVMYDKKTKTFYDRALRLSLIKSTRYEVRHGLPSAYATFSVDTIASYMGLDLRSKHGRKRDEELNIRIWVPLETLERAQSLSEVRPTYSIAFLPTIDAPII
ncbi:hypothetical protein PM082_004177 [Marasmius tenuissimus]|nr:hypothetical protein PM082_004177 [Marasmius tenuissimus]